MLPRELARSLLVLLIVKDALRVSLHSHVEPSIEELLGRCRRQSCAVLCLLHLASQVDWLAC